MNLIDILDLYAMEHGSDNLFLMLQNYTLDSRIDRDTLNRVIVKELGAASPYVHNTTVFKFALEEFFNKYNYNIGKLLDTMYLEYNPLNNKNMFEEEHRKSTGDIDNTDDYATTQDLDTENKVSAFDATTYQPKDMQNKDAFTEHHGTTSSDIESTVDTAKTIKGKDGNDSYQTLIEQERRVADFNIFNWIIQRMRKELFLLVY